MRGTCASPAASRTFSVPWTFASYISERRSRAIPTSYIAARWKTPSTPSIAPREVADDELGVEQAAALARADQRDDLVAALSELRHQPPTEKPRGAGDE